MTQVDYKALYFSISRQNGELATMVERYQREIIPQFGRQLEMARAERDSNDRALIDLTAKLEEMTKERDSLRGELEKIRRETEVAK